MDENLTLKELCDRFMTTKKRKLEKTSYERYEALIAGYLAPALGTVPVRVLRKVHILDALEQWQQKIPAPSPRTIKHAFDLLRNVLNWAVRFDFVDSNIALKISSDDLPTLRRPESHVLNERELWRLLQAAKQPTRRAKSRCTISSQCWFAPAIHFAAYTGARRGEVLALKWTDIDFDEATVTIRESLAQSRAGLSFKPPKNGKSRTITLGHEIIDVLKNHMEAQMRERLNFRENWKNHGLVFAMPDGSPVTPWNFGHAFSDLVERSGVTHITLHDMRDTHASLLAKAGVPIEVVSQRLGHSSIGVTVDRYLTVYRDRDRAASKALDNLLDPAKPSDSPVPDKREGPRGTDGTLLGLLLQQSA